MSCTQKTKAFGLGFSDEPGTGEKNPVWGSTESTDPSRLIQNLPGSNFIEEK